MYLHSIITATHLKQWADTKQCQEKLPLLIRKLIRVTNPQVGFLQIPCGDSTHLPGFDAMADSSAQLHNVQPGKSVWEFGCDKDVLAKANGDYEKRSKNPLGCDCTETSFVFVTPREWAKANEWVSKKKEEGRWKDIVVLTATELEDWISQRPVVCLWLAELLGKLPNNGVGTAEQWWKKWAYSDEISLNYEIVLSGRFVEQQQILEFCRQSGYKYLQASTHDEGIAFVVASLMSGDCVLGERLLIAETNSAYLDLLTNYRDLIIVTKEKDNIAKISENNHTVIHVSCPDDVTPETNVLRLPAIEREGCIKALTESGIDEAKAKVLATDTVRDINILRRRLGIEHNTPEWAKAEKMRICLPAMLLGRWNTSFDGDKEMLASLAQCSYQEYSAKIAPFKNMQDSPFMDIGSIIRVKSSKEAISYLLTIINEEDAKAFIEIIKKVFDDIDNDAVPAMEDELPQFRTHSMKYSEQLKEGVFQNMALLMILADSKHFVADSLEKILREFYSNLTLEKYLTVRHNLRFIVEASPELFLDFLEKEIKNGCRLLDSLFEIRNKDAIWGGGIYYSELLWALESTAWNANYLYRVTDILLSLCDYKHKNNYANSPYNSLKAIYRPYVPQTYATFEQCVQILKTKKILQHKFTFNLCVAVMNFIQDHVTFGYSSHFTWRLFERRKSVKKIEFYGCYIHEILTIALECCNGSSEQLVKLLDISENKHYTNYIEQIVKFVAAKSQALQSTKEIESKLRKIITRHLSYPDAKWTLKKEQLKHHEQLLEALRPKETREKHKWLFEDEYLELPGKKDYGDKYWQRVSEVRCNAVKEIINTYEMDGLWCFIKEVESPRPIAECLVKLHSDADLLPIYEMDMKDKLPETFTRGYYRALAWKVGIDKFVEILNRIKEYNDERLGIVAAAAQYEKKIREFIDQQEERQIKSFWKKVVIFHTDDDNDYVCHQLCDVGRVSDAIRLAAYYKDDENSIADSTKLNLIQQAVSQGVTIIRQCDDAIHKLFEELDKSEDQKIIDALVPLEFLLFDFLHHYADMREMRLVRIITNEPKAMMQLIEMCYAKDTEFRDDITQTDKQIKQKKTNAILAFRVFYKLDVPLCQDENGKVDVVKLQQYINTIRDHATEKHYTNATERVIGRMLANIPRKEDYPPAYLCDIIEEIGSEELDDAFRMQMLNQQGVTTRAYNEGGTIERARVQKYKQYKDKTKFSYRHITAIFDDLIKEYEQMAIREDISAKISDYEY